MCLLEGAEAGVVMASGMAAIYTTFMALLKIGRSRRGLFFLFLGPLTPFSQNIFQTLIFLIHFLTRTIRRKLKN